MRNHCCLLNRLGSDHTMYINFRGFNKKECVHFSIPTIQADCAYCALLCALVYRRAVRTF